MWYSKKAYGSAKKSNYDGYIYDSKFEAGIAQELDLRKKAKEIVSWERQVTIPLVVNGYKIADYRIDFIAYRKDGIVEYIEAKGYPTPVWRLKWKIFEALYSDKPDAELVVIWQGKAKRLRKPKKV